jgi:hypothetical protein
VGCLHAALVSLHALANRALSRPLYPSRLPGDVSLRRVAPELGARAALEGGRSDRASRSQHPREQRGSLGIKTSTGAASRRRLYSGILPLFGHEIGK